jgi:hypothetical protein
MLQAEETPIYPKFQPTRASIISFFGKYLLEAESDGDDTIET